MRLSILAAVAAAAATAVTGASAAPYRPAAQGMPFVQLGSAVAGQLPTCPALCYAPQQLRAAYDFPTGPDAPTGAGQTIVVVTAYGSPTLAADVAAFDTLFGLPPADLTEIDQKLVVAPQGSGDPRWPAETALDVEYAHAMAPGAKIVVAVAANDDSSNFAQVEWEVLPRYPGSIVTQSFGGDETGNASDPAAMAMLDALFLRHVALGGTVVASSGDFGATNLTPFADPVPSVMADYPASSPFVLSVGGTMGNPYPGGLLVDGAYGGEQVWNEVLGPSFAGASGGAPSVLYPAPFWQLGLTGSNMRAEPDVAYNAAANGGVLVVSGGRFGLLGGTSAAAPQWAAIVALANELRARAHRSPLGIATPYLYQLARDRSAYGRDFHDVTVGDNAFFGDLSGLPGFDAGPGYDLPTGLGTPDVANLLHDLSARAAGFFHLPDVVRPHGQAQGGHQPFGPGH